MVVVLHPGWLRARDPAVEGPGSPDLALGPWEGLSEGKRVSAADRRPAAAQASLLLPLRLVGFPGQGTSSRRFLP